MIRALVFLALLACSRPEPRSPMPDIRPTLAILARVQRWAEERLDQPCAVPMRVDVRAEYYYPQKIPVMQIARTP